jgi:hypothetical protein
VLRSRFAIGESSCEVVVYEDEKPPVVDISMDEGAVIRFTIPQATALHAGLGCALEMFVAQTIGEETFH